MFLSRAPYSDTQVSNLLSYPHVSMSNKFVITTALCRYRGSTVVKMLYYKSEGRWFDPSWCQWMFHCPGVDSASKRNEYQEYFLGSKSGRCVRLTTYHHPLPLSRNLGTLTSWNQLGHSRPIMGLLYLYHSTLQVNTPVF